MDRDAGLFEAFGGTEGCRKLSEAFYTRVARDPILRPLFPSLHCAIPSLAIYLAQLLGGPSEYSRRRWSLSLREAHLRFKIGPKERTAWLMNMRRTLDDFQAPESLRDALQNFFEHSSAGLLNRGEVRAPAGGIRPEMSYQWDLHQTIEETVTAIRNGERDRATVLAESPLLQEYFGGDPAALLNLLALMCGQGLEDYVCQKLLADPRLAHQQYFAGRTLLHGAAAAGSLRIVELLFSLGADPNARDLYGHTPLYCLANECAACSAGDVVRALARAGANLDAQENVKRCTALHMAARRGNIEVAGALLDCGANLELRDSKGETPLRRAVNCGKTAAANLLLSRGADPFSRGSLGLTPLEAARTPQMQDLFASCRPQR